MLNFLRSLFAGKTVDSVISDILQKIEHLHVVAELHADEQAVQAKIVGEAIKVKTFAEKEYVRAKEIASRLLAAIVNG